MIRKGKAYAPFEVLPKVVFAAKVHGRRAIDKGQKMDFDGDLINMASERLQTFAKHGVKCVQCGIEGKRFYKERYKGDDSYHLNLYALNARGKEVLMTRDHVIPKALGGANHLGNYQTLCAPCNRKKGRKAPLQVDVLPHILLTDEGLEAWMQVVQDVVKDAAPDAALNARDLNETAELQDDGSLLIKARFAKSEIRVTVPPSLWRWVHAALPNKAKSLLN